MHDLTPKRVYPCKSIQLIAEREESQCQALPPPGGELSALSQGRFSASKQLDEKDAMIIASATYARALRDVLSDAKMHNPGITIQNHTLARADHESKVTTNDSSESSFRSCFDNSIRFLSDFWKSRLNKFIVLVSMGLGVYAYHEYSTIIRRRRYLNAQKTLWKNRPLQRLMRGFRTALGQANLDNIDAKYVISREESRSFGSGVFPFNLF